MHIVIDVPDDFYMLYKNGMSVFKAETVVNAFYRGSPLPKGHGDLKDMGNLKYVFDLTREDAIYSGKDIEKAINSMKIIIEADNK